MEPGAHARATRGATVGAWPVSAWSPRPGATAAAPRPAHRGKAGTLPAGRRRAAEKTKLTSDMWMIVFFVLPAIGLAYTLWHIWSLLPFGGPGRTAIVAVCLLAFLTVFLSFSRATDDMPLGLASACYETGNSAIFVLLYMVMAFMLLDAGRLLHIVPRHWLHANGYTSAALLAVMAATFTYGYINYRHKVRQPLELTTAKDIGRDMKVVMLSDLHIGYHNRRKELARWVDMINAEHADAVLIAGDLIDGSLRPLAEEGMDAELRRISAPVFACPGNHEYIGGIGRAADFMARAGITLLRDSVATAGGLCIIGRDDRSNPHRRSIAELMRKADNAMFTIVLDHQPYHLERTERAGADFQLSGHTHHGQLWPISWITDAVYECAFGPWQRGRTRYYVSSGMGIWGGKFRIGTRSEYIVATIRRL